MKQTLYEHAKIRIKKCFREVALLLFLPVLLFKTNVKIVKSVVILTPKSNNYQQGNDSLGRQKLLSLLRNTKFRYCLHSSPAVVSNKRLLNLVNTFTSYDFKTHFNFIFPCTHARKKW